MYLTARQQIRCLDCNVGPAENELSLEQEATKRVLVICARLHLLEYIFARCADGVLTDPCLHGALQPSQPASPLCGAQRTASSTSMRCAARCALPHMLRALQRGMHMQRLNDVQNMSATTRVCAHLDQHLHELPHLHRNLWSHMLVELH